MGAGVTSKGLGKGVGLDVGTNLGAGVGSYVGASVGNGRWIDRVLVPLLGTVSVLVLDRALVPLLGTVSFLVGYFGFGSWLLGPCFGLCRFHQTGRVLRWHCRSQRPFWWLVWTRDITMWPVCAALINRRFKVAWWCWKVSGCR